MGIEFRKISEFNRGKLFDLLADAYSFDSRCEHFWGFSWREFDDFFFDNLEIADRCGFITTLNEEAIGFVSYDPRNMPEHVIIGHNCIASRYKGFGYGKTQLQEAIKRISERNPRRILVTTNEGLFPASRMYESVGFKLMQRRPNDGIEAFIGEYIDYVYQLN